MGTTATEAAPGRRDRKKQQTRAALVAAALRLVDERGRDHVTVEEIAEAADVSPRTFFNYFATKDDALLGGPLPDGPPIHDRLLAVPAGVPLIEALFEAMRPDIEQIQAERDVWLLRLRVIKGNPALLPLLVARGECAEEETVSAVAARTGIAPDSLFPQLVATTVGAAFRTSMMRWATGDGRDLLDLVREAFDILGSGLTEPAPTHEEVTR
ncbi:TetR family transcriptional regulator [Paractinoplanes abujensis]|uniref:AcrR family transcriptional regulator n=1 Tax=Paractinoplanes abujensis TaxID=882441 RepID=A0A7W7D0J8_9ACTN|nr:TetR family transcriptional regulator [Actinoplanes abujensis]MBB4697040.1 AcrR family transcriptional regulator [Actinoplanes abujensis]GID18487.1 TetR family transcriptional regulator [Actinoplanes abujensis]